MVMLDRLWESSRSKADERSVWVDARADSPRTGRAVGFLRGLTRIGRVGLRDTPDRPDSEEVGVGEGARGGS